ncbi:Response regulator containing a CheY-like receiver domain and an HTH DNA-binding domain [Rubrobacter radiotolerans]|uniref:Response regulator containing a CheY-like receiver domain and an HTH DNA-binding domain n=1 Tax=Rubrobacter radiotolerans TaxID=42256 RepID=A0A023X1Y5_RUBRA|nr:response regulator transcription factor [Rubrobacter radiotolerans]AHY46482.1 Response regulator containing a CheY-like receiver domain and an HTH DNA-binding domain [Rubrobacter radiotolerans]MDX5893889.1 response regulator transcription factor [Rubrobacter radiotolerans]SMC04701.1 two component transcriptional regulator, LuxR family [Rubrobacter radiotolerans DSM 5868]
MSEMSETPGETMEADPARQSRVLLVEDHLSFREALAYVLNEEPRLTVSAQAGTVAEGLARLEEAEIAVVDLGLPDGDGVDLIRSFRRADRGNRSIALTAAVEPAELARAVEAGASGVIHKSTALDGIVDAILLLREGEIPFSRETEELLRLADRTRSRDHEARRIAESFTDREREVLSALARGLENAEIASKLGISVRTQRTHMMHIANKLGAHSRLHALVLAVRYGVVDIR